MANGNYYDVTEWSEGNPSEDIGAVINSIIADIKSRQANPDMNDGGKPGAGDGKPGDGKPGKGDETKPDTGKKGGLSATGAGIVPIAAAALTLMAGAALALAKR